MRLLFLFLFLSAFTTCSAASIGYFCVPVADLLLKPLYSRSIRQDYEIIAVSPEHGQYACLRVHQGIFNEQVAVVQEHNDELQVAISNCFFDSAFSLEKQNLYWTHKKNIILESDLAQLGISPEFFPAPISFLTKEISDKGCLTLLLPWRDEKTGVTYSVGTRFKRDEAFDTREAYGIAFFDFHTKEIRHERIDGDYAVTDVQNLSLLERQRFFVEIMRLWARCTGSSHHIAYVWGGISWHHTCGATFSLEKGSWFDQEISYWIRPDQTIPCSGFDCSGLILRAAQIVGLPYFFKNTTTILHHMRPMLAGEEIENGDIIWCPGHVMVVSDVENNLLIEARGYKGGSGKLLEIYLGKRFVGLSSYDDLKKACSKHIPLRVNDSPTQKSYKILKMKSLYEDHA